MKLVNFCVLIKHMHSLTQHFLFSIWFEHKDKNGLLKLIMLKEQMGFPQTMCASSEFFPGMVKPGEALLIFERYKDGSNIKRPIGFNKGIVRYYDKII